MTQPRRVLAFLDVGGAWDPSLALVMAAAVGVYAIAWRLAQHARRPAFASAFDVPTSRTIDARLVAGALVFGIGWGTAGMCPGPALTSLASGEAAALVFVTAMLAGMAVHRLAVARRSITT